MIIKGSCRPPATPEVTRAAWRVLEVADQSIASPVASKGAATTSPATGTTRAASAVTLNGRATAPHPATAVQISIRANMRIDLALYLCQEDAAYPLKRLDEVSRAMPFLAVPSRRPGPGQLMKPFHSSRNGRGAALHKQSCGSLAAHVSSCPVAGTRGMASSRGDRRATECCRGSAATMQTAASPARALRRPHPTSPGGQSDGPGASGPRHR